MSDWEIYRALRTTPVEALVFALAGMEPGLVCTRVRRYVTDIRHRTLSVTGDDLLALGMKKGPAVGRMLETTQGSCGWKGSSTVGRAELEAARQMVKKSG